MGQIVVSSVLVLPRSRPSYPPPSVVLCKGEGRVAPKANKLACRPTLMNTGWLGYRGTASAAADKRGRQGWLRVTGGKGTPCERLADSACKMLKKTPGRDESTALASWGGGSVPKPPGEGWAAGRRAWVSLGPFP